jgi:hypothetical protein
MRCLSRMSGNLQVRFLGGGAVATSPCCPAALMEVQFGVFETRNYLPDLPSKRFGCFLCRKVMRELSSAWMIS